MFILIIDMKAEISFVDVCVMRKCQSCIAFNLACVIV